MARSAADGAGDLGLLLAANDVQPQHILNAAGYLFVCPENLATMSGMMKEMFDRCYYAVLGQVEGRPYATAIAAGSDGEGAQRQLDRIATGWRLKRVADPVIVCTHSQTPQEILAPKQLAADDLDRCHTLAASIAEGIRLGIF